MTHLTGQQVVVTGADGFIGSHLVERLIRDGAYVKALCMYNSFGSLGWLEGLSAAGAVNLSVEMGDIRDAEAVRRLVAGADVVFHLAALIAIPYSYRAPRSFVETNIIGTLNVLEACRATGVGRMVNTSTSEVYGTPETVPISESHPLQGQSPYSASKIAADKMCEAFALSFELPVVTLRPFNTYGPRQSTRAVIPVILSQLLAGYDSIRLGSLAPRRDFTFVGDTVDGFVRMATADVDRGSVVQLGTGESVSIGELFDLCCDVVGSDAKVVTEEHRLRPEGSEVMQLLSDPEKAQSLLGWKPMVGLREGLSATADWLREHRVSNPEQYRW